jgi:hypothetical protein
VGPEKEVKGKKWEQKINKEKEVKEKKIHKKKEKWEHFKVEKEEQLIRLVHNVNKHSETIRDKDEEK